MFRVNDFSTVDSKGNRIGVTKCYGGTRFGSHRNVNGRPRGAVSIPSSSEGHSATSSNVFERNKKSTMLSFVREKKKQCKQKYDFIRNSPCEAGANPAPPVSRSSLKKNGSKLPHNYSGYSACDIIL